MRYDRFHISQSVCSGTHTIQDMRVIKQLSTVLRAKVGERIEICGNNRECYLAEIDFLDRDQLGFTTIQEIPHTKEPVVHLAVAITKKDTFEWIVQKATELGVTSITPLITERTIKMNLNHDRLVSIATEAAEQSKRNTVPVIYEPIAFTEYLQHIPTDTCYFADMGVRTKMSTLKTPATILIGPEGGWSEKEKNLVSSYQVLSLGIRPLRAETAAIVALSTVISASQETQ